VRPIDPPAFYGKLPGHGDFVSRGLAARQEKAIDRWLAGWLGAARAQWAGDFEANYRDAQPWLFSGDRLSAVAIPSADRVGRLFPLLAAAQARAPMQQLYDTVIAAMVECWDGDRLHRALGEIAGGNGSASEPDEWSLPDAGETAMPHPAAFGGADLSLIRELLG
jgi:type VI secretion system ImpM family protein